MIKVLVDRDALEKHVTEIDSWNANMEKIIGKQSGYSWTSLESLREALAQPAVQEPYPHGHPLHKAVFMARESYTGRETFEDGVRGLIAELKDALESLSVVTAELTAAGIAYRIRGDVIAELTAERDRLLQEKGDPAGSFEKCMQAMRDRDEHAKTIDQLRAEVEGLRENAERWRYVSLQGDDTHWLNLLRVDLEDFGGNINAAVDALIDGEAPAMAAKEA